MDNNNSSNNNNNNNKTEQCKQKLELSLIKNEEHDELLERGSRVTVNGSMKQRFNQESLSFDHKNDFFYPVEYDEGTNERHMNVEKDCLLTGSIYEQATFFFVTGRSMRRLAKKLG